MARGTISTGGRPISAEPGYKRQLKANAFAWEDSPATSRPLMRIVGEPENASSVAMLSSLTSTSRTSAATPSELRTSLTSLTAAGWDGHSATYKTSTFIDDRPFFAHLRPARSGNACLVCAALCRNCAEPTAV